MTESLVTPSILSWARMRRGMEVAEIATKLNVKPEAVSSWEAGEKRPTFRQAQRIAQALYVPFGYLYLAEPPIQELPLTDFRTLEVLRLVADQLGTDEIAEKLKLSDHTVRNHIRNVRAKLGVATKLEAVMAARRLRLL